MTDDPIISFVQQHSGRTASGAVSMAMLGGTPWTKFRVFPLQEVAFTPPILRKSTLSFRQGIFRFHNKSFAVSASIIPEQKSQEVRVRFAPSPTGNLHVGGARTALFNYLFARLVF